MKVLLQVLSFLFKLLMLSVSECFASKMVRTNNHMGAGEINSPTEARSSNAQQWGNSEPKCGVTKAAF
jgi:hypothetical protein